MNHFNGKGIRQVNWRRASLLPAIVALAFGAITTAPSASALGGSVVDNGDGSITATGLAMTTDVLWICPSATAIADCNVTTYIYGTVTDGTYTAGSIMNTPSGTAAMPDGVYTMAVGPTIGARIMGLSGMIIGTGGGEAESTPPAILQQFGKSASGTCDEVAQFAHACSSTAATHLGGPSAELASPASPPGTAQSSVATVSGRA